jgi:hypothetical protein
MPHWQLNSGAELAQFNAFIINALIRGELDLKKGYILAPLLSLQLRVLELTKAEERTAAVDTAFTPGEDDQRDDPIGEKENGEKGEEGGNHQTIGINTRP